jgi:hypothetical protein
LYINEDFFELLNIYVPPLEGFREVCEWKFGAEFLTFICGNVVEHLNYMQTRTCKKFSSEK